MRTIFKWVRGAVAGLVMLGSVTAWADGVTDVTINPATGLTIAAPGSYRLASNIVMSTDSSAITIAGDNVSLDLNGHTLTAFATTTNDGITGTGARISVTNGNVIGFGGSGLRLSGSGAVVRNVRVAGCNKGGSNSGIETGASAIIEGCTVQNNTPATSGPTTGIKTGDASQVTGNIAENNDSPDITAYGISTGEGCSVIDNIVRDNTTTGGGAASAGILAGDRNTIRGNTVTNNDNNGTNNAVGIKSGLWSLIQGNVASGQTTGASGNATAIGISCGGSSKIFDNVCENNDAGAGSNGWGIGIATGGLSDVRGNYCDSQTGAGTGFGIGIGGISSDNIIGNFCIANGGTGLSWGIRMTGSGNLVAGNTCTANGTAGLLFVSAATNRAESNRFRQTVGIDTTNGVAPASVGAGDLANLTF